MKQIYNYMKQLNGNESKNDAVPLINELLAVANAERFQNKKTKANDNEISPDLLTILRVR